MRVTWRALVVGWKAELATAAEYRADLIIGTFISALWLFLAVVPAVVVFGHVEAAAGWTLERLLLVQAIWYAMDGVMWLVIMTNIRGLSDMVRTGELDFVLLQPGNSLARMSLSHLQVADLPKFVLAALLAGAAIARGVDVDPLGALQGLVGIAAAMVLMWSIGVLSHVKAITTVKFEAGFVVHAAHNLARIPVNFYGPAITLFLTFVVPIAFLATIPAELFFGAKGFGWTVGAVGVAALSVAASALAWRHEIARYSGATA